MFLKKLVIKFYKITVPLTTAAIHPYFQLRREISGLSHLASEYYEVKKADPDNISLDR